MDEGLLSPLTPFLSVVFYNMQEIRWQKYSINLVTDVKPDQITNMQVEMGNYHV